MKTCVISILLLFITYQQVFADNPGLVRAAQEGNKTAVLRYLEQGVSIETSDKDGKTALIAASQHGHTDIIKLLLDRGASVKAGTSRGSTALYYAAQNHHIDAVKLLHARGPDVNTINLNQFSPLSVAIVNRDETMVRLLLDLGADPNRKPTESPLLTEALARGDYNIFRILLDKGAAVDAVRDGYGETTLMIAVAMQNLEAVKLLLKRGANIRLKDKANKGVIHWLLCNTFSEGENTKLLALLLKHKADYDGQASSLVGFKDDSTPLMCATRRGFNKSVNMLLARRPNLNLKDSQGHTALYYAVEEENVPLVKTLLAQGADPSLEAELQRDARSRSEIGELLLAALQPRLEARAKECPEYSGLSARASRQQQPAVKLDPLKSENFPLARVEVLDGIPNVGQEFSLSPDGKWLIVREDDQKSPSQRSQRLIVYDIAKQQAYFFSPEGDFRVKEDRWLKDSSRYVLLNYSGSRGKRDRVIDVSSGAPRMQTLQKPIPHEEPLLAGGDACPWRDNQGHIILSRPERGKHDQAWTSDGKVFYSFKAAGGDNYYLTVKRGTRYEKLVHHSAKWSRDKFNTELESELPKVKSAEERARLEKFKAMLQATPLAKLSTDQFVLSPNNRYLYYRISDKGGSMLFGSSNRHVVVDLHASPVQAWYIDRVPWGTPQWHPNGRDLYFIDQSLAAQPDPDFPPMRQPARWKLSVVRFR